MRFFSVGISSPPMSRHRTNLSVVVELDFGASASPSFAGASTCSRRRTAWRPSPARRIAQLRRLDGGSRCTTSRSTSTTIRNAANISRLATRNSRAGTDVAATAPGEILARQKARPEQQRTERLPQPAVEGDVASARLAHELEERRRPRSRLLTARWAVRARRRGAAVAARRQCGVGSSGLLHPRKVREPRVKSEPVSAPCA